VESNWKKGRVFCFRRDQKKNLVWKRERMGKGETCIERREQGKSSMIPEGEKGGEEGMETTSKIREHRAVCEERGRGKTVLDKEDFCE